MSKKHYCIRNFRPCTNGAFDGKDNWDIDCPSSSPANCPFLREEEENDTNKQHKPLKKKNSKIKIKPSL